MTPRIWFITPAWKRYGISDITFAQRAWALEQLRAAGIEAEACVIADDENLDLAWKHGFGTVEVPNDYLGTKFNEGYAFAAQQGANYVCPIGSDSWLDPTFIINYFANGAADPNAHEVIYSRHYAVVRPDGKERAQLLVVYDGGTTMFYPTAALAHVKHRPVGEQLNRGCDGSTIAAIKAGGLTRFTICEAHDLETVSFQTELQVTDYDALIERWGCGETDKPFAGLEAHYPKPLITRMRGLYKQRAAAAAA